MTSFPTTYWYDLQRLQDPQDPAFQETLSRLIERYWTPAYHYLRAIRRLSPEDAQDLVQQFFARLLERRDWERLSPERGSFRGFLKTSLRNFLVSAERAAAARRPKDGALFSFDPVEAEWLSAPVEDPDAAFDREWTRVVLLRAVELLRERLESQGKGLYWELFREYCLDPSGIEAAAEDGPPPEGAPSYKELAARHGTSEDDVRNHLRAARRTVREILAHLVRDYLDPGEDQDRELVFLLSS